jgi:hypothetical protein
MHNPKTKSPREGGLTRPRERPYAEVADRRTGSLAPLMGLSTFLYASAVLVGVTTRRTSLNSDRGSGPLNAQRVVGKREPQQGSL